MLNTQLLHSLAPKTMTVMVMLMIMQMSAISDILVHYTTKYLVLLLML